jgi:hypothetical protein
MALAQVVASHHRLTIKSCGNVNTWVKMGVCCDLMLPRTVK